MKNEKVMFQNELEEVTERLSEMVARPYLRTPRSVIVQTTALARRKRHEFARAVAQGLLPPETPPTLRKLRRRNYRVVAIDTNNDAVSGLRVIVVSSDNK